MLSSENLKARSISNYKYHNNNNDKKNNNINTTTTTNNNNNITAVPIADDIIPIAIVTIIFTLLII